MAGDRLELPNGIPSHDTFRRVFLLIDPDAFLLHDDHTPLAHVHGIVFMERRGREKPIAISGKLCPTSPSHR